MLLYPTDEGMPTSRVLPGDILLNITGASLGRTCVVPDDFEAANVNQHVCVIRLRDASLRAFLSLLLKSAGVKSQLDYIQNGAAREGLNFSMVSSILCPLPSPEERDRIAAFLDHETAKIDALIAEQQRLIELLQEKRQAVISHAVTKGLNPDAPMKDSRIEWLGEVPEHWRVGRLKTSVKVCRNGIWGDEATGNENDVPCVRVADFDRQRLQVAAQIPTIRNVKATEREGRTLSRGNLLLEKSGGGELQPVGCVVLYDDNLPAICSNFVARMELEAEMNPSFCRYLHAAAYTVRLNTRSIKQTSGIQNLDQQQYLDEVAAFPPKSEQTSIALAIENQTARFDALVTESHGVVDLLQERRSALISAAVTGQIDVRGFSTGGTEAA